MARILIVDDASFIRMKYARLLSDAGFEVIEAENGAKALEKYKEFKPDAVLLDINMPVMNGIITLHEIMNIDPSARVAMVTCIGSQSIVLTALRTGAKDFVLKPFDENSIITTVQRLLN